MFTSYTSPTGEAAVDSSRGRSQSGDVRLIGHPQPGAVTLSSGGLRSRPQRKRVEVRARLPRRRAGRMSPANYGGSARSAPYRRLIASDPLTNSPSAATTASGSAARSRSSSWSRRRHRPLSCGSAQHRARSRHCPTSGSSYENGTDFGYLLDTHFPSGRRVQHLSCGQPGRGHTNASTRL